MPGCVLSEVELMNFFFQVHSVASFFWWGQWLIGANLLAARAEIMLPVPVLGGKNSRVFQLGR